MENDILLRTLLHLKACRADSSVVSLCLTRFFTVAELADNSVGACMSYYFRLSDQTLSKLERRLGSFCRDPFAAQDVALLQQAIFAEVPNEQERKYVIASVLATIISALSAPFICAGGDKWFSVERRRPINWTEGAETALVVGFGGYLKPFIEETSLKKVHVIDLYYENKKIEFDAVLAEWTQKHPEKHISISTHIDDASALADFDLVSITGSTLCNGTLEFFMMNVRRDAMVILQGQSASLHPKVLFESGVKWVATTIKPRSLINMARRSHSGEEMRSTLQGGLPWIYLVPRVWP
jgi:Putative heavy-metal chelation